VLHTLNYVEPQTNAILLKGKVAGELNHMELLITELLLENAFTPLSVPEVAAVLSCTTCQFKTDKVELTERMQQVGRPRVWLIR
jgi:superfamily II RNA helicase